jgi:hypothetical protein
MPINGSAGAAMGIATALPILSVVCKALLHWVCHFSEIT